MNTTFFPRWTDTAHAPVSDHTCAPSRTRKCAHAFLTSGTQSHGKKGAPSRSKKGLLSHCKSSDPSVRKTPVFSGRHTAGLKWKCLSLAFLLFLLPVFSCNPLLLETPAETTALWGSAGPEPDSGSGQKTENLSNNSEHLPPAPVDLPTDSEDPSGSIIGTMTAKPLPAANGTTTMYVSSALTGRHGLCVLLENVDGAGNHRFGMIDTGNAGSAAMKSFLQSHGVKSLDFLILTHMHKDHIGNAVYLLKNYTVRSLYLKQFDAHWSDGLQDTYEKILQTAASNMTTQKIIGVSYALSMSDPASPSASAGWVSWLKAHPECKSRFKGLFSDSNISFGFGSSKVQLFNWEIWGTDGITRWQPGRTRRCRASAFSSVNSDNHFSMGVRVVQGTRRFWIGGDINNLRLEKKKHAPYKGDEDRIRASVGPVDAMVMNHHGNGGSNTASFLQTLSPTYAVYTSIRTEITDITRVHARASFLYLKNTLHLPEDHILWAANYWNTYPEDPVVSISSSKLVSSRKDGTDITQWKGADGANCAAIPLKTGHSYTTYDLTGDGKPDLVQILYTGSGKNYGSLSVKVNRTKVFSFKKAFSDPQPVTLLLQPGRRAFLCIAILSPEDKKSRLLQLYRCKENILHIPSLDEAFDILQAMPDQHFVYQKEPVFQVSADRILLSCTGRDSLGARLQSEEKSGKGASSNSGKGSTSSSSASSAEKGTFTFCLVPDGRGLKTSSVSCRYALGKTSRLRFQKEISLYRELNSAAADKKLPAGTAVTVTHAGRTRTGALRYRIKDPDGNIWWIK